VLQPAEPEQKGIVKKGMRKQIENTEGKYQNQGEAEQL